MSWSSASYGILSDLGLKQTLGVNWDNGKYWSYRDSTNYTQSTSFSFPLSLSCHTTSLSLFLMGCFWAVKPIIHLNRSKRCERKRNDENKQMVSLIFGNHRTASPELYEENEAVFRYPIFFCVFKHSTFYLILFLFLLTTGVGHFDTPAFQIKASSLTSHEGSSKLLIFVAIIHKMQINVYL